MLALLSLAGTVVASPAQAQCRLCDQPSASADFGRDSTPIALEIESQLDFDRLILSGGGTGTAMIGADGEKRAVGALEPLSGRAMVGRIVVRGEPNRAVAVVMPESVELSSAKGAMVRIDSLVTDLPRDPRLDSQGMLTVNFGGHLTVSGDIDGDFRGSIAILVDYL